MFFNKSLRDGLIFSINFVTLLCFLPVRFAKLFAGVSKKLWSITTPAYCRAANSNKSKTKTFGSPNEIIVQKRSCCFPDYLSNCIGSPSPINFASEPNPLPSYGLKLLKKGRSTCLGRANLLRFFKKMVKTRIFSKRRKSPKTG